MSPEDQPEHFKEIPEVGTPVLFWPGAIRTETTTPMVGFVTKGWSLGMANITVVPDIEGAVMVFDDAFHVGDKRVFDPRGQITRAAANKGCWEHTPIAKMMLEMEAKAKKPKKGE